MLQANQRKIAHTTNVGLINLRNQEITYFTYFFTTFALQASFVLGCVQSLTPSINFLDYNYLKSGTGWLYLYFVGCVISLISSVHCVLVSLFVLVFGLSLALRGPIGSLGRAIDGMVEYQQHVVLVFNISVYSLSFGIIGLNFTIFFYNTAIFCTIITILAMFIWYHYSLQIFNLFREKASERKRTLFGDEKDESNMEQYIKNNESKEHTQNDQHRNSIVQKSILKRMLIKNNRKSIDSITKLDKSMSDRVSLVERELILCQGYMTVSFENNEMFCYVVLYNQELYFYTDNESFLTNPTASLNRRPKELYNLTMTIPEIEELPYQIILKDNDTRIKSDLIMSFDTVEEISKWVNILSDIIEVAL